ncbi:MAG TPA: hypothetical protein ENI87_05775 [bacterium]|nr:hypothetical protein [bacterium]
MLPTTLSPAPIGPRPRAQAHEAPQGLPRTPLPQHRTEFTGTGDALLCPCCGEPRRPFGEEVTKELERLEITFVREIVRKEYSCPSCQGHVVLAESLACVIEKDYAAKGLSLSRSELCTSAMRGAPSWSTARTGCSSGRRREPRLR